MPIKFLPPISESPQWGDISGSILFQNDLQNILDSKSAIDHNHQLANLSERNYSSLDGLPDLGKFMKSENLSQPQVLYSTDGIDDYLQSTESLFLDASANFSFIMRALILQYDENVYLASKSDFNSKKGWMLHCNYGVARFSIGDGADVYTINHSFTIEEARLYQFSISYDFAEKKVVFGIDNHFDEFVIPDMSLPLGISNKLLFAKNPLMSEFSKIGIHSFVFFNRTFIESEFILLYNNYLFDSKCLIKYSEFIQLWLDEISFGNLFWYDLSGCERHTSILGGLLPSYRATIITIPLINLDEDILLSNAIIYGYSLDFISVNNLSSTSVDFTCSIGSEIIVDGELIESESARVFTISRIFSLYENKDILIELGGTSIEADIQILLRNQLPEIV